MALNRTSLEETIYQALLEAFSSDKLPVDAKKDTEERYASFASDLASAIEDFVKSGTVSTNVTTVVNTSTSTGVGTGTGTIS
jgi:hypothetical protein